MTLSELRTEALTRYGNSPYGDEDAQFPVVTLNHLANEAHRWLARVARLYQVNRTMDLPLGSGGISTVNLAADVFEVNTRSGMVRIYSGGSWRELCYQDEESLRLSRGPLENASNGNPYYYFFRSGATDAAQRQMLLWPGADEAVTNGLQFLCWVSPAALSADAAEFPAQAGEEDALIVVLLWKMAELEQNRTGAANGAAGYQAQAQAAALKVRSSQERWRRGGPRRVRQERW